MDNRLYKGIEEIKKIGMTPAEKSAVLARVLASAPAEAPMASPWSAAGLRALRAVPAWMKRHERAYAYATAVLLAASLSCGGVAFAAQGSEPGDPLYAVKVGVVEPLRAVLAFSAKAKAQLAASLAAERLDEAEKLAAQGRLDYPKQEQIMGLLEEHAQALNQALSSVRAADPRAADAIGVDFKESMHARARALDPADAVDPSAAVEPSAAVQAPEPAASSAAETLIVPAASPAVKISRAAREAADSVPVDSAPSPASSAPAPSGREDRRAADPSADEPQGKAQDEPSSEDARRSHAEGKRAQGASVSAPASASASASTSTSVPVSATENITIPSGSQASQAAAPSADGHGKGESDSRHDGADAAAAVEKALDHLKN